jgi:LPXTG-site transpeptidase (sortase) family protein
MKHLFKIIISLGCVAILLFLFIYQESPLSDDEKIALQTSVTFPVKLSIEKIGVYASVEPVGVLDNNAMAVPSTKDDVGWYKFGPNPGDQGSAVFAGHVNWTGGQDAVFTSLNKLETGDVVKVLDNLGVVNNFVVTHKKDYSLDGNTNEVFSSSDGIKRLNLITCDGEWDPALKTHTERLVVFTEKIE